jgi:hypothetical protein
MRHMGMTQKKMDQSSIQTHQDNRRELARNRKKMDCGRKNILKAFCPLTHTK